jgi:hypothetical protein
LLLRAVREWASRRRGPLDDTIPQEPTVAEIPIQQKQKSNLLPLILGALALVLLLGYCFTRDRGATAGADTGAVPTAADSAAGTAPAPGSAGGTTGTTPGGTTGTTPGGTTP